MEQFHCNRWRFGSHLHSWQLKTFELITPQNKDKRKEVQGKDVREKSNIYVYIYVDMWKQVKEKGAIWIQKNDGFVEVKNNFSKTEVHELFLCSQHDKHVKEWVRNTKDRQLVSSALHLYIERNREGICFR